MRSLVCLFYLLFSACLQAKSFIVGVEDFEYRPLHWVENNEYTGFNRDVLDAFGREYGHNFSYIHLPVGRLFHDFLEGDLDFKYPDNPHWSREIKAGKKIVYSSPVSDYVEGVLVVPEKKGNELEVLGTVLGFTPWPFQNFSDELVMVESRNFVGVLKMALSGRSDGAFCNVDVANYYLLGELGVPGGLVFDGSLPHVSGGYSLSSMLYRDIIDDFDVFIKEEHKLIAELKVKYGM